MKTSARNEIQGKITRITTGKVNSDVGLDTGNGLVVEAVITNEAVKEMDLAEGQLVTAIVKSSFIIISAEKPGKTSARNVFEGKVTEVLDGVVSCELKFEVAGIPLTAVITEFSEQEMGIKVGDTVYALVKASSIILLKP